MKCIETTKKIQQQKKKEKCVMLTLEILLHFQHQRNNVQ